ncbi:MAG TPA: ATP synthase F1 subunit epsilon [Solirubrobacteraceae bacterium]|jgi:F-type H+-transporting ATPase subunit epsilon|nr:ATP synthase F1 subunit epsilon [Solirubrobacteraceae bacterium]
MARTKFPVEVLTPEGEVFSEEIEMLSTRTAVGSIGVLANHEPVLAMLEPTELRLYRSEGDIVRFAQAEGYLQFAENRALVLVEEAIAPEALDRQTYETRLKEARQAAEQAEEGTEQQARAQRDIRRYEAFLAVGQ